MIDGIDAAGATRAGGAHTHVRGAAHLAQPLRLKSGVTLKNRLAKSAMSEGLADRSGDVTDELATLYARFARGGAGLLMTGNAMITEDGVGEPGNVVLPNASPDALAAWARAASANGTTTFLQVNHAGRQAPRRLVSRSVAPSAVRLRELGAFSMPRPLEDDEILELVAAFGRSAAIARRAGFAGIQLHAAHGYLLNQFLSPRTNLRADRWGGSLDNRMRFLLESFRSARSAGGEGFGVGVKLNSADFLRGGFSAEDAVIVARTLSEEGVDLLEVSGGTYERPEMAIPTRASTAAREAHFLSFARDIRGAVACPIMLTGGVRTPALMEEIVADGSVDVVGLARPLALEPDLPGEILAGRQHASRCDAPRGRLQVLNAAVDNAWYQAQLQRMGRGGEPDPRLGRWRAIFESARRFMRARRAPARPAPQLVTTAS